MHEENEPRFSDAELAVLDRVLDEVIPPSADGRMPGAGQLGLSRHVDRALRAMPELRAMFAQSVAALEALALRAGAERFAELAPAEQREAINQLAASADAFPPILILHAFSSYYQHPDVLAALGLAARPPHPEGYEMEPNDLSLLDPVRRRARLYRVVEED